VVTALTVVLRGQTGRNPVDNDDTTRRLSGRSVRVLAFGLALSKSDANMGTRIRRRQAYGGQGREMPAVAILSPKNKG
jgi:hypothetical protein